MTYQPNYMKKNEQCKPRYTKYTKALLLRPFLLSKCYLSCHNTSAMKPLPILFTLVSALVGLSSYTYAQERFTSNEEILEFEGDVATVDPAFSSPTALSSGSPIDTSLSRYRFSRQQKQAGYTLPTSTDNTTYPGYSSPTDEIPKSRIYRNASVIFEHFGDQRIKQNSQDFSYTNLYLTAPLRNPRKNSYKGWHFALSLNMRFTWINENRDELIRESSLYTTALVGSLIYNIDKKAQLTLGVNPLISTDFDHISSSSFYLGAFAALSYKASSKVHVMLGLSYSPEYYSEDFWPLANVNWQVAPTWMLRVQAHRLSLTKKFIYNRKKGYPIEYGVGPFAQWNNFLWSVKRDGYTQLMRMDSFLLGVTSYVNIITRNHTMTRIYADLGLNFAQNIDFENKNTGHTINHYSARPGLYARIGTNISF